MNGPIVAYQHQDGTVSDDIKRHRVAHPDFDFWRSPLHKNAARLRDIKRGTTLQCYYRRHGPIGGPAIVIEGGPRLERGDWKMTVVRLSRSKKLTIQIWSLKDWGIVPIEREDGSLTWSKEYYTIVDDSVPGYEKF